MSAPRSMSFIAFAIATAVASASCTLVAGIDPIDGCTQACSGPNERRICPADEKPRIEACPAETPQCTGNAVCVQCVADEQCQTEPGEGETCQRTRCIENKCVSGVYVPKAQCGKDRAGVCNEAGVCLGSDIVLSALRRHTCLRTHDSKVYCWGDNSYGELGDGTRDPRGKPVRVKGLPPAVSVVAGYAHTCAIVEDGGVYCWGNNQGGQIGDGNGASEQPILTPTRVVDLPPVKELAVGQAHACVLTTSEEVWCWGYNDFGQSGQPTASRIIARPLKVSALSKGGAHIQANKNHTCMLQNAKPTLVCWGNNEHGQLARDPVSLSFSENPVEIAIPGEGEPVAIALGFESTCAVVPPDGHTYCWGWNKRGQLGNGVALDAPHDVPQKVLVDDPEGGQKGVPLFGSLETFRTDGSHGCVRSNLQRFGSKFLCWGADDYGELGFGEVPSAVEANKVHVIATPTKVIPATTITLAQGEDFTCLIVAEDGVPSIQCFGTSEVLGIGVIVEQGAKGTPEPIPKRVVWDPAAL